MEPAIFERFRYSSLNKFLYSKIKVAKMKEAETLNKIYGSRAYCLKKL